MKYTKKEILTAGKLGEISMIDVKHLISLLDEAREHLNRSCYNCKYSNLTPTDFYYCDFDDYDIENGKTCRLRKWEKIK